MRKRFRGKSARKNLPLLANLFVLLTLPLAIYSLMSLDSFDTRNRAVEEEFTPNTCSISFPYVNPSSIESGNTVQVQVVSYIPGAAITKVEIIGPAGVEVFNKSYDIPGEKISEVFTITPSEAGEYSLLGTVTTDQGVKPCVLEGARIARVLTVNNAPAFLTQPTSAIPSNAIKVNDSYQYTLKVEDDENDTINYHFSFTPDADWLKYSVIEDGGSGKLSIKFSGVADKPASYLANLFVHDGYNTHLRAQSWVISVEQEENDVPQVTVYTPADDISVTQGDSVSVSWEVSDLNQIVRQEIYVSSDPGNENSWKLIDKNLSGKVGTYVYDTSNLEADSYQFIIRAIDNGDPSATGIGVSPAVGVDAKPQPAEPTAPKEPDDGVILQEPQIVNISPSNDSTVENQNTIISATLIAGTDAQIKDGSIKFVLDNDDLTEDAKLNKLSDSETTVTYTPQEKYDEGLHKVEVSFEDSEGGIIEKSWVFTVELATDDSEDTYNIFGYEIQKRMALILGGGIGILLLALIVPWLLYLAWRGSDDNYEEVYKSTSPMKPTPPPEFSPFKPDPVVPPAAVTPDPIPVKEAAPAEPEFATPQPVKPAVEKQPSTPVVNTAINPATEAPSEPQVQEPSKDISGEIQNLASQIQQQDQNVDPKQAPGTVTPANPAA